MCGRITLTATDLSLVVQRFGVKRSSQESTAWTPRYNIAPTQTVIVVSNDGQRYLTRMRWGLIPS